MGLENIPPLNGGGGGGSVDSVFGRTGIVTASSGDYDASQITETTTKRYRTSIQVRNGSGSNLQKGDPIYFTGSYHNGIPIVDRASNDNASKMPCIGVIETEVFATATNGYAITDGLLENVDTSALSQGSIYVGTDSGTRWTNIKPTGTAIIQNMGYVITSHVSTGSAEIQGSGRINDLPNLAEGKIWEGNSSGVPTQIDTPVSAAFTKVVADSGNSPYTI